MDNKTVTFDQHGRTDIGGAAEYLGLTKSRLYQLRTQGRGPVSRRLDGKVFYFKADLDLYISSASPEPRNN